MAKDSLDDEITVLSPVAPDGTLTTLYKPEGNRFVGDVDLHFSAERMLFSMPDEMPFSARTGPMSSPSSALRSVCLPTLTRPRVRC